MDLIQKLFGKCGSSTPSEAAAIRPVKTLQPVPTGSYTDKYFPYLNPAVTREVFSA
jgi:hypothetical protein